MKKNKDEIIEALQAKVEILQKNQIVLLSSIRDKNMLLLELTSKNTVLNDEKESLQKTITDLQAENQRLEHYKNIHVDESIRSLQKRDNAEEKLRICNKHMGDKVDSLQSKVNTLKGLLLICVSALIVIFAYLLTN